MLKTLWYGFLIVTTFSVGYKTAETVMENKYLAARNELYDTFVEEHAEDLKGKDAVIDKLMQELKEYNTVYSDLKLTNDRLRDNLARATASLSANNNTCVTERKALRECQGLLVRGTELLERGVDLFSTAAINNDALLDNLN